MDVFEKLVSKGYAPLMQDGLDLLARTTINANDMRTKGENFGNVASLVHNALNAWDQVIYSAALVTSNPERVARDLNALPYQFVALSGNAQNFGNDYAQGVLAEELFAYGGAILNFPAVILGSMADDPEKVNDGIRREDTVLVEQGLGALSAAGLAPARRFYDAHKDRLDARLEISK